MKKNNKIVRKRIFRGSETLDDGKKYLKEHWLDGTICPCCNQQVKLYQKQIDWRMAKVLIDMVGLTEKKRKVRKKIYPYNDINIKDVWIHVIKELQTIDGNYAKLRFWKLVEAKDKLEDEDVISGIKKASGYWKITKLGEDFVKGKTKINKYVYLYNNRSFNMSHLKTNWITIQQALNKKFNYNDLMNNWDMGFQGDLF